MDHEQAGTPPDRTVEIKQGQLLAPGVRRWGLDPTYVFRKGRHELRLFIPSPTPSQIAACSSGEILLAAYLEDWLICMGFKIPGAFRWCAAMFSWWRVPPADRTRPVLHFPEGQGAPMLVILTDAATGIVQCVRLVGLAREFSLGLHQAIQTQVALGTRYSEEEEDALILRLHAKHADIGSVIDAARGLCWIPAALRSVSVASDPALDQDATIPTQHPATQARDLPDLPEDLDVDRM